MCISEPFWKSCYLCCYCGFPKQCLKHAAMSPGVQLTYRQKCKNAHGWLTAYNQLCAPLNILHKQYYLSKARNQTEMGECLNTRAVYFFFICWALSGSKYIKLILWYSNSSYVNKDPYLLQANTVSLWQITVTFISESITGSFLKAHKMPVFKMPAKFNIDLTHH